MAERHGVDVAREAERTNGIGRAELGNEVAVAIGSVVDRNAQGRFAQYGADALEAGARLLRGPDRIHPNQVGREGDGIDAHGGTSL